MRTLTNLVALLAVIVFAFGKTPSVVSATQATAAAKASMELFLLAGQSNMAGRGRVEDMDRAPHPRVWMFDRSSQWTPAIEPMHFDKPIAGVGPGRSFGVALADGNPSLQIGLIPAAVGGSPVTAWEPGVLYKETGAYPWDDAMRRARAALPAGELRAILWHQGESDANAEGAPRYEQRLRGLIQRFRDEFGNPALPFIIGQLGRFEGRPWSSFVEQVDAAHRRVASEVLNVAYVSSEGLRDQGDNLHFSNEAERELGRRYAEAYLAMAKQ
jgi:hypothetical protein